MVSAQSRESLLRKVHPPQEVLEAGVGAERVASGVYFDFMQEKRAALLVGNPLNVAIGDSAKRQ